MPYFIHYDLALWTRVNIILLKTQSAVILYGKSDNVLDFFQTKEIKTTTTIATTKKKNKLRSTQF